MTLIMGVLNVTPDSFSDGGEFISEKRAVEHGLKLHAQGADIIDVGGESTRPGAVRVEVAEEQQRILPVVTALSAAGIRVSVDTLNSETARAAVEAGAHIVNDVSGGLADPAMFEVVAATQRLYIMGHWRGGPSHANVHRAHEDIVTKTRDELHLQVSNARAAGVFPDRIVLDPGLGFSKKATHNWQLLAGQKILSDLGYPVMVGASRKRFLGELMPPRAPFTDRDLPTAIITVLSAQLNAWAVRVHNVAATRTALDTWAEWEHALNGVRDGTTTE
ncbi:dihydropteroate synthase [Lysinibacter sp. HNR]|uniref:dihydropteroate synthase n=1 Tax=Lysinibacter sp. HNR TaxID=3031408 RepID=UPI0024356351|nr:dihydropteroate synthase [Lysinibacter sp. HNR]WGD36813.1 dihydropteroate synthase [Lysinibacter sp. HNR]